MKVYTEVPHCSVMVTLLGSYKGSDFSIKKATGRLSSLTKRGVIPFSNKPTSIILFILYNSMALRYHLLLLSFEGNLSFLPLISGQAEVAKNAIASETFCPTQRQEMQTSDKSVRRRHPPDLWQLKRETIIGCENRSRGHIQSNGYNTEKDITET